MEGREGHFRLAPAGPSRLQQEDQVRSGQASNGGCSTKSALPCDPATRSKLYASGSRALGDFSWGQRWDGAWMVLGWCWRGWGDGLKRWCVAAKARGRVEELGGKNK